jgi:hypothetical protein
MPSLRLPSSNRPSVSCASYSADKEREAAPVASGRR